MQGSSGTSRFLQWKCSTLQHASGLRDCGTAGLHRVRGAGHCPLEIGRNTKEEGDVIGRFQVFSRRSMQRSRREGCWALSSSLSHLGTTLACLGRC